MSTPPHDNSGPQWGPGDPQASGQPPGGDPYQAQQPGSKFGTQSYSSAADYNAPIEEPKQFSLLKTLTLASLGLYMLSQLIGLIPLFGDDMDAAITEQLEATGQTATPEMVDAAIMFSIVLAVVLMVIAVGLYLLVYFGLRGAKNWARIMGIVFAILGLVLTFGGLALDTAALATGFGMVSLVISIAWAAISIYWLVLAFSAPVRSYLGQR